MIPFQYRALAWLLLALSLVGGGFYSGHHWATTKAEAALAKAYDDYVKQMQVEIDRGNALAARVEQAESRVVIKTVEVIKHVPSVTTGRKCLDPAAVSLLQPTDTSGNQATGKPVAEGSADLAASDTDIAYWIAEANQYYETCAARLNGLIEWHAN